MIAIASAVVALLVMMVAGLTLGAAYEFQVGHLNSSNLGEYVVAFLVAMPTAFALVIAVVYIPVVLSVRVVTSGAASPRAFGAACIVATPLAGLILLTVGSLVWGPPKSSVGQLIFNPTLLAMALGGLAFGLAFGQIDRRSRFLN